MTGAFFAADGPDHVHAVAVQAGNAEGEHIFAPLPAHVLLDHVNVVAHAAGSHNDAVAEALDLLAVISDSQNAANLALRTGQDLLDGGVQLDLNADLLGILMDLLDHGSGAALGGLVGAGSLDHVLSAVGVLEVLEHAQELNAHLLDPLHGARRTY